MGLDKVYIAYGSADYGTYYNRLTFYLPGGTPIALQFPSYFWNSKIISREDSYQIWSKKMSQFPVYDVNSYPLTNMSSGECMFSDP